MDLMTCKTIRLSKHSPEIRDQPQRTISIKTLELGIITFLIRQHQSNFKQYLGVLMQNTPPTALKKMVIKSTQDTVQAGKV